MNDLSTNTANSSEDTLVEHLQRKDKQAFGVLYDKYSAALFGIIVRIVRSEKIGEDVLQEAFVKIWKSIDHYDSSKARLFTWMLNIARNLAIDKTRSKSYKQQRKNRDLENIVDIHTDGSDSYNPDRIGLKELLRNLPGDQQSVIDLIYFGGYTQSEVSKQLEIPLGTVKTRARTAIGTLRKIFQENHP